MAGRQVTTPKLPKRKKMTKADRPTITLLDQCRGPRGRDARVPAEENVRAELQCTLDSMQTQDDQIRRLLQLEDEDETGLGVVDGLVLKDGTMYQ